MDGIINVYKERGYTSHDVVAKLRGILRMKKIGHTGTLDPEAQGVLPVCLGKATKVCDLLTDKTKTYQAVLLLGQVTDTQDTTGTVLEEKPVTCSEEEVRSCIEQFVGTQEQIPPMYSALKVNGRKLYELARQGVEVERKARTITIDQIVIDEVNLPEVTMTVTCSKGTYIRTLCHDIGAALGCGGCMKSLLRTQVGPFVLSKSVTLAQIEALRDEQRLDEILNPTDSVFGQFPAVRLSEEAERLVRNGNPLTSSVMKGCADGCLEHPEVQAGGCLGHPEVKTEDAGSQTVREVCSGNKQNLLRKTPLRIYAQDGTFLAVYEWNEQKKSYRSVKMFL